jgi:hypothetical protein
VPLGEAPLDDDAATSLVAELFVVAEVGAELATEAGVFVSFPSNSATRFSSCSTRSSNMRSRSVSPGSGLISRAVLGAGAVIGSAGFLPSSSANAGTILTNIRNTMMLNANFFRRSKLRMISPYVITATKLAGSEFGPVGTRGLRAWFVAKEDYLPGHKNSVRT